MGAQTSQISSMNSMNGTDPLCSYSDYHLYNNDVHGDDEEDLSDGHQSVSVFITSQYKLDCNLEKFSTKLKQYRHPCILHFVSWSVQSNVAVLETEKVSPLTKYDKVIEEESFVLGTMEICQALSFLHKAGVCHGNVSQSAVFITPSGRWRLGGLEMVSPSSEGGFAKDIQAFGLMITELLSNSQLEASKKFRDFAKNSLLLPDVRRLPSPDTILQDPYFQQPFVKMFQFLVTFPVHPPQEKQTFFKGAADQLKALSPSLVATQLAPLLLSRYVMLDANAQSYLIPNLLVPQSSSAPPGLDPILPLPLFQSHLVPQLKRLFMVPDTTIRLTLLSHWPHYVPHIPKEELEKTFLPYILMGMRDSDPDIVASTLNCLADMVPILGPEVVVGSSRTKIFHDRSPSKTNLVNPSENIEEMKKVLVKKSWNEDKEDNNDDWDDWEDKDELAEENIDQSLVIKDIVHFETARSTDIASNVEKLLKNVQDLDIMKLDVKVSKIKSEKLEDNNEIDFFADMTPKISRKASALDDYEAQLMNNRENQSKVINPIELNRGEYTVFLNPIICIFARSFWFQ